MIKLGTNFTHEDDPKLISALSSTGQIQFAEILIDNFIYFDPYQIKDELNGLACSFHVMNSQWTTDPNFANSNLIQTLKKWLRVLNPIYVSDHLLMGFHDGSRLPLNVELNYDREHAFIVEQIAIYRNTIESQIFLENYPSYYRTSTCNQIEFFSMLFDRTRCGILFDFSNAFIAEHNVGCDWRSWLPIIKDVPAHFHIGGYSRIDERLLFDAHDGPVDASVVKQACDELEYLPHSTLVVERDANKDILSIADDLAQFAHLSLAS